MAVVRVRKIKSLAFHLPFSGQLAIGEELTDGQELVENSGSFGGGRKRDRTSDLGLVRAALSQLSYPPVFGFSRTCGCASTTETPDVPETCPRACGQHPGGRRGSRCGSDQTPRASCGRSPSSRRAPGRRH